MGKYSHKKYFHKVSSQYIRINEQTQFQEKNRRFVVSQFVKISDELTQSRGLGKSGRQGAICWLKKELSCRHGTLYIFL